MKHKLLTRINKKIETQNQNCRTNNAVVWNSGRISSSNKAITKTCIALPKSTSAGSELILDFIIFPQSSVHYRIVVLALIRRHGHVNPCDRYILVLPRRDLLLSISTELY